MPANAPTPPARVQPAEDEPPPHAATSAAPGARSGAAPGAASGVTSGATVGPGPASPTGPPTLALLFRLFLKAGCLGFGGFVALMAMLETVLVKQRRLLPAETVLDGVTLASILPGPQAVNVAAYCGHKLRGARGAWVAGVAVVLPSFVVMLALAALYERYGALDAVTRAFRGVLPAAAAVIAAVVWRMAQKALATRVEAAIAAVAAAALFTAAFGLFGFPRAGQLPLTFALVAAGALAGRLAFARRTDASAAAGSGASAGTHAGPAANSGASAGTRARSMPAREASESARGLPAFPFAKLACAAGGAALLVLLLLARPFEDPRGLATVGTTFGGLSVMLFGGGYVFIPMMQHEVVDVLGWVGAREFLDAVALSQVMPGPILVAATFLGWMAAGLPGAVVATCAIFAPPAALMVVASQVLERVKRSAAATAALRGVRAAVVGMIAVAALVVLRDAAPRSFADVRGLLVAALLFGGALVALLRLRLDVVWVVPASGAIGWFLLP